MRTLTRDVRIRATAGENAEGRREFTGLAVPWDTIIDYPDGDTDRECFARGAITNAENCRVFWRHGEVIGIVTEARDTDDGWEIDGRISDTSLGRDAYALLKDGAVSQLSIGFEPITHRVEDGVKVWTSVRAREVSLVPNPAYESAAISAVRNRKEEPRMSEDISQQVRAAVDSSTSALSDDVNELRAAIADLASRDTSAPAPALPYDSFGEYVRAVATGDEAAAKFHREYAGGTTADTINLPAWVGDVVRLVEERRPFISLFNTATLPAQGMNLEYGRLDSNTIAVAEQADEGDDLVFGKVSLTTSTTPVRTFGGWTELSRQEIERSTVGVLDFKFRAFAIAYAAATEGAVRKAITDHLTATAADSPLTLAGSGVFDYLDAIVDAASLFRQRGYSFDGLGVSPDVYKALVRLTDGSGDPIFSVWGPPTNRVGELNLSGITGGIANVPVTVLEEAGEGTLFAFDRQAVTTWESAGAPFQLQDENIVNLTKQFSVYGYMAAAVQHPGALVPITAAGA